MEDSVFEMVDRLGATAADIASREQDKAQKGDEAQKQLSRSNSDRKSPRVACSMIDPREGEKGRKVT